MGCLFVAMMAFFPRIAVAIVWLARPALVGAAFDTFIFPLLGLIFLPFTTLIYLILFTPGVGISGWDWLWIALAVVIDVGNLGANSYSANKGTGWRT